jgi:Domain of unknown function (DUF4326)
MSKPKRIQRKRSRGWTMPEGAVYVGRPTKWGNPYRVWDGRTMPPNGYVEPLRVVEAYRNLVEDPDLTDESFRDEIRRELRGKDLACWCPLDKPCHADVLLEIANS